VPLRSGPPAEPESVPTTAHPSIPSEGNNNPDDFEALLKSAIEKAKRLRTSRVVEIQRDLHETAFLAKDTKSGLVVMRHEDSKRLKELCDWFGWQVIDGGMPGAED
jgi:hypothetical protein